MGTNKKDKSLEKVAEAMQRHKYSHKTIWNLRMLQKQRAVLDSSISLNKHSIVKEKRGYDFKKIVQFRAWVLETF